MTTAKRETTTIGIRSLTDDVMCQIEIEMPVDSFRSEVIPAFEQAVRRMVERIDFFYKNGK